MMPSVYAPPAVPTDWLTRFSQAIGRVIPDAMSTAVGMLLLLGVGALAIGNSGAAVMDAFYRGLWMLLPFTMQMALILVLSSTLGAAPVFRQAVARLSRLPRTRARCSRCPAWWSRAWGISTGGSPSRSGRWCRSTLPARRRKRGSRLIFHSCSPRRRRPGRSGSSGSRRARRS